MKSDPARPLSIALCLRFLRPALGVAGLARERGKGGHVAGADHPAPANALRFQPAFADQDLDALALYFAANDGVHGRELWQTPFNLFLPFVVR